LVLGTTLAMTCFREAVHTGGKWSGYGIFVGLAIGLLAKGPLVFVIALPPLGAWLLLTGRLRDAWKKIPWLSGTLLMLAIALPWYIAAERKTPGFLDYFLIGEHWKRFTVRGWQGDLYGNAHPVAPGMIWTYLLLGSFPWCLGFIRALPLRWQELRAWAMADEGRRLYWALWAIWPVLFFTPARNIIATYPLPALPALALLLASLETDRESATRRFRPTHPAVVGISMALVGAALVMSLGFPERLPKQSERALVQRFRKELSPGDGLIYYGPRKYSAEFYTEGAALHTTSASELISRMDGPGRCFVAIPSYWLPMIPSPVKRRLQHLATWGNGPSLYVERTDMPDMAGIDPSRTSPIGN